MTPVSSVVSNRPILRVAGAIILAFCLSAPLVWAFSNLVVYGVRAFGH
jgi:hypothetical protein